MVLASLINSTYNPFASNPLSCCQRIIYCICYYCAFCKLYFPSYHLVRSSKCLSNSSL